MEGEFNNAMSTSKKITILIKDSPYSGDFCEEALRACVGLKQTEEKHIVNACFVADGVWFCSKSLKQKEFLKYILAFKSFAMDLNIEKESLDKLKLTSENISSDFKIISRADISKILLDSDHVFTF